MHQNFAAITDPVSYSKRSITRKKCDQIEANLRFGLF